MGTQVFNKVSCSTFFLFFESSKQIIIQSLLGQPGSAYIDYLMLIRHEVPGNLGHLFFLEETVGIETEHLKLQSKYRAGKRGKLENKEETKNERQLREIMIDGESIEQRLMQILDDSVIQKLHFSEEGSPASWNIWL